MKTLIAAFLFLGSSAFAQDSWDFKSSQDSFTVTSTDGQLTVGGQPVNKKAFDAFLKVLLRPNRGECQILGKAELTVEAKSGNTNVIKKFYPKEGAIESNGKCADLDWETGWTLPFHREWLTGETTGKITPGNTMKFKSADLEFQVFRSGTDWSSSGKGFSPDLIRMADFSRAAENISIEKRYSKKAKENATQTFTLSTGGATYKFFLISGLWAIEFPRAASLAATKDFSMLGRFSKAELGDRRSEEMTLLSDRSADPKARIDMLEKMSNVDSPVFKATLHNIVKDPEENLELKERVALLLVDRPSADNIAAIMMMFESPASGDHMVASKSLKRIFPAGPIIEEADQFEAKDKINKWKEWYKRYRQANK